MVNDENKFVWIEHHYTEKIGKIAEPRQYYVRSKDVVWIKVNPVPTVRLNGFKEEFPITIRCLKQLRKEFDLKYYNFTDWKYNNDSAEKQEKGK